MHGKAPKIPQRMKFKTRFSKGLHNCSCTVRGEREEMEICIVRSEGIDCTYLSQEINNHSISIGYSTMHPVMSPILPNQQMVVDWFNQSSDEIKRQFRLNGCFCIYEQVIANEAMTMSHGYKAEKGEILSTDESWGFDWTHEGWKAWL